MVCCDLEGVYVPEVWLNVAEITGIDELRYTTRDIKDYSELMNKRLEVLAENNLKLKDVQDVINQLEPLEGALEFLEWLKENTQVAIVSDTFKEFADPLMEKLKRPMLFCNSLIVNGEGRIVDFVLRQPDQKKMVVKAMKSLNYEVVAFGDSYNDISMLQEADKGILFRPSGNVIVDYPEFPATRYYDELKCLLNDFLNN